MHEHYVEDERGDLIDAIPLCSTTPSNYQPPGGKTMQEKRYQVRETDHPRMRYAVIDTWKDGPPVPRYQSHREAWERAIFLNEHPQESRYGEK